jgi:hypothetical protein
METATPEREKSRVGFSRGNPLYRRAIAAETGRALGRMADELERLARDEPVPPVFELHVDVPWDFTPRREHPVGRPAYGEAAEAISTPRRLEPIDLSDIGGPDAFEHDDERARREVERVLRDGRADGVARFGALASASHLTLELVGDRPEWAGLPVEIDSHGRRYAIRLDLRDWIERNIPHPESAAMAAAEAAGDPWSVLGSGLREKAVESIAAGFVVGFGHATPEDFPAFLGEPLVELLDDEIPDLPKPAFPVGSKRGLALVQFGPCVLDGPASRACFTIGASVLVFDEEGEGIGRSPTSEEMPVVVAALRELAAAYRPVGETLFGQPIQPSDSAVVVRRPKGPSMLLDVRARMDPETVKLTSFAVEGSLPRQWRRARRWEDAERERVDAILRQHGDEAFEKTDSRPALLVRRRGEVALAGVEANRLTTDLGTRGGFIRSDDDGEWLVRALRVGAGFVTIGISWYRSAERLISERREEWARDFRARLAAWGGQKRLAFDELSDDEKEKIERVLEHIGTLEDARRVLDLVLRRAFATGASVVDFPAHELRILLECDGPGGRGNERVRKALAALEELSFKVVHKAIKGTPSAKFQGRFVAAHYYYGAGEGARADGVFVVELASAVPGVASLLGVMSRGKTSLGKTSASAALQSATRPTATERAAELLTGSKADDAPRLRQRRRKGDRPAKALSTVGPYRKRAVCRTVEEERAFDFIEANLTTSQAADVLGRRKRARKDAGSVEGLRLYSREWCPLLGDGEWVGALGTHRRSPETGWTLSGRGSLATKTGGGRPAGLVDHVGRQLPTGSAHAERLRVCLSTLDDFLAVLEPFGGLLVGVRGRGGASRRPGAWEWIDLEEARELDVKELLAVRWYPFLPADWTRRADELVEKRQAERVERGEGERAVLVTRSPSVYLDAAEASGVRWKHRPGETETLETWPDDGRERPAPDMRPLGDRLAERIEVSGIKKGDVAKAFGISPASLSRWLRPLAERDEHKGSGVPEALSSLVERWVDGGPLPTPDELDAVSQRRGRKPLR